jgi:Zn-dependent protease with chaperone function
MVLSRSANPAKLRMPPHYGLFVLAGMCGFAVVLAALMALYCWLIWSGVSPFIHFEFGRGTVTVQSAVLRILLGLLLLLLTWRSVRGSEAWKGIEVAKGSCPPLEELVGSCAARAGVTPPEAIYLTPDTNIAAYSSGIVRGDRGHATFINIGVMLLPILSRAEFEAAIFHEFGHLVMRRDQWAVSLDNRIRDFVPRLRLVNQRGKKFFFIAVSAARLLLLWYWNLFNLLMAPLRRREELLADDFAAGCCGKRDYARRLTAIVVLQQALDGELADRINGRFHAALLGMPETCRIEEYPNWFDFAAEDFPELIMAKADIALAYLRDREDQRLLDEHPTLRARISRLDEPVPESLEALISTEDAVTTEEIWQRQISAAFAERMRPEFYEAKRRAGLAPDEGFTADSVASYPCRFTSCRICGQTNLVLSRHALRWVYQDKTSNDVPWEQFSSVEVIPNGRASGAFGPLLLWIMAMYSDLPSLAEAEVKWQPYPDGKIPMRTLQLYHLRENMREAMDLIEILWYRSRTITAASKARDLPMLLRELEQFLNGETAPTARMELIQRQAGDIRDAHVLNVGQMRWREFGLLLNVYGDLLDRAQDPHHWAASVKGRRIVLEQLNRRDALRTRIARMGLWSFFGRLLWLPMWVRVAVTLGTLLMLGNAVYLGVAWRHQRALALLPFVSQLFANGRFRLSFQIGVILLSLSLAARICGNSVMESADMTLIRAYNCEDSQATV